MPTEPVTYQTAPLSDDEKDTLKTIYRARLRIFIPAYLVLLLWGVYIGLGVDRKSPYSDKVIRWEDRKDVGSVTRTQMQLIDIALLEVILTGSGLIIFYKRINPYRRDMKSGMKQMVPYLIIRKEYFALTGQYFVALDDPDYLHHEVNADTYNRCSVGENMYLARAVHSKYVFEINGRFMLM